MRRLFFDRSRGFANAAVVTGFACDVSLAKSTDRLIDASRKNLRSRNHYIDSDPTPEAELSYAQTVKCWP